MKEESNKGLLVTLAVLVVLSLMISLFGLISINNKVKEVSEPDLSFINAKLETLASNDAVLSQKIDSIELSSNISTESGSVVVEGGYDTKYSVQDKKKSIATDLSLKEIEDNDFIDEVYNLLRTNGIDVDDDKDLVKIKAKDFDYDETEVDLNGEDAIVTMEFNVYYIEDSDDEECGKVRIQVDFYVEDLDRDQNYEDAEVDRYDITLEKKYGIDERHCIAE